MPTATATASADAALPVEELRGDARWELDERPAGVGPASGFREDSRVLLADTARRGGARIGPGHLPLALAEDPDSSLGELLRARGVSASRLDALLGPPAGSTESSPGRG